METNRAKAVAMKAEVRRTKARLMDEIKKLHKLAQKKVKICLNFGYFGVLMYVCNWRSCSFVCFREFCILLVVLVTHPTSSTCIWTHLMKALCTRIFSISRLEP